MRTTTVEAAMAAVASDPLLAGLRVSPGAAAPAQPAAGAPAGDDLSAMSWVHAELRRCLEAAHKSLRRYLREAEPLGGSDLDTADPAPLSAARQQLHQGVGALEMLNQPALAQVLRASEAAVQRIVARPALLDAAALETIEANSFALLDALARLLAGKPVSPVQLFPQYRATQQLAGADRIHPADLSPLPWQWRELPADASTQPRAADERARSEMEALVLALMRQADGSAAASTAARMSDLCADMATGARWENQRQLATLWQLAAAMFEAQASGLLRDDLYVKRIASRLLAQLRMAVKGQLDLSDRLAQDLLFFCHHAGEPSPQGRAPRLAAVRATWPLPPGTAVAIDYETPSLGRFDPAMLAQARKRLVAAKDAWSAVAGGELHRLASLGESFALVEESVRRIFPHGDLLGQALAQAAQRTEAAAVEPAPTLAMEVATALLYLDACLEDAEFDHPELPARTQRLAERVAQVGAGGEPAPLETWMEELYRRVSDRQTMGSVVQELRASLTEVEKHIDQFFRQPQDRQPLAAVPQQLAAMRGVLSVLGIGQASQAVLHMRDDVEALIRRPEGESLLPGEAERLADNLGALSFLIDMLGVQPHLAKQLFAFDAAAGRLRATMGQAAHGWPGQLLPEPAAQAGVESALAPTFAPVAEVLSTEPAGPTEADAPRPPGETAAPLPQQVQALAATLAGGMAAAPDDDSLLRQLDGLAQLALASDESELARTLGAARVALGSAADDATRAALRQDLAQGLLGLQPVDAPAAPFPVPAAAAVPASADDEDAEMLEVFLEEAQEVLAGAHEALERLALEPGDATDMTQLRRAFHTLKGSGRMVGLTDFGEAAWASEQLFNARLAQQPAQMDATLHRFTRYALDRLGRWVQALAARAAAGETPDVIVALAQALRLGQPFTWPDEAADTAGASGAFDALDALDALDSGLDSSEFADEGELEAFFPELATADLASRVPGLPSADDLDLGLAPVAVPEPVPQTAPVHAARSDAEALTAGERSLRLPFEFDLQNLGQPLAEPTQAAELLMTGELSHADALAEAERMPLAGTVEIPPEGLPPAPLLAGIERIELDLAAIDLPVPAEEPPPAPAEALIAADAPAWAAEAPAGEAAEQTAPQAAETSAFAGLEALGALSAPADDTLLPLHLDIDETAAPVEAAAEPAAQEETVKVIGHLRIGIPLFNIYLNEADEISRRLGVELAEWALQGSQQPLADSTIALAHSLAGSSATVGYADLSALARALEHALMRAQAVGVAREGEAELFTEAAEEIRRLLHQFAAGFLREVPAPLLQRLADHERWPLPDSRAAADPIDPDLFPIFAEEAEELLPALQGRLRDWLDQPGRADASSACMRTLHTFKGGARLAGAMRLGDAAHRLETEIEQLVAREAVQPQDIEPLLAMADQMSEAFAQLQGGGTGSPAPAMTIAPWPTTDSTVLAAPEAQTAADGPQSVEPAPQPWVESMAASAAEPLAEPVFEAVSEPVSETAPDAATAVSEPTDELNGPLNGQPTVPVAAAALCAAQTGAVIDWARFHRLRPAATTAPIAPADASERNLVAAGVSGAVRVRAGLLDRLVNQAGEVSITRARIDADVRSLHGSLQELSESLERMRRQLRDIELQAETQISSRMEQAKANAQAFDPLEMDRFTRFQELTRFMAESVNDVATLQRSLARTLQSTEDELAAQARLTRELQDDLLRTRMVEFESMADRLYRTVRQAAKETGKAARLEIAGGAIEIDRGVLERMTGPFEHLLRNSVVHGIETAAQRAAAGKPHEGKLAIQVTQAGNEVAVEFSDDGAGLDLPRIRQRAIERGLLATDAQPGDDELAQLIFAPGFSTATTVTELAGRGVGMDVVRAEVNAMGGRIEIATTAGQGTRLRLLLPLTTAVTQVVMLRCGVMSVAVPSTLIELVRRVPLADIEASYDSGQFELDNQAVPFFWLPALLQAGRVGEARSRAQTVVIVRSAAQRVALHVDEVVGNQEVVVKNVGPQLARLPGLTGVTLLPSGVVSLIYNPVALAAVYADGSRSRTQGRPVDGAAGEPAAPVAAEPVPRRAPLVLVVDDSLTVRRVTQRLLVREGYRVTLAKDGMEALEKLAEERPAVLLSDIEMPRMDGFDLLRNVRADKALAGLPVVMITSRIAQKHRDYAQELGVDHYLGKPYAEDLLLSLVARFAAAPASSAASAAPGAPLTGGVRAAEAA